ncbi:MAG: hypothetical protein ACM3TR_09230 [Caulobacteraceae bacterium]
MNLVSSILVKSDLTENQKLNKANEDRITDDYGYSLYQSLEYDVKYLKSNDFGYKASLLNIIIK